VRVRAYLLHLLLRLAPDLPDVHAQSVFHRCGCQPHIPVGPYQDPLTLHSGNDQPRVQDHAHGNGDVVPAQLGKPDPGVEAQHYGDQGQRGKGAHEAVQGRGAVLAGGVWHRGAALIGSLPGGQDSPVEQRHLGRKQAS